MRTIAFALMLLIGGPTSIASDFPSWIARGSFEVGDYETLSLSEQITYSAGVLDGLFIAAVISSRNSDLDPLLNCITTLQYLHIHLLLEDRLSSGAVADQRLLTAVLEDVLSVEKILEIHQQAVPAGCDPNPGDPYVE